MFEVLVFVYENYWRGDACPELRVLGRKLSAVGFDADEIQQALKWLDGLNLASRSVQTSQTPNLGKLPELGIALDANDASTSDHTEQSKTSMRVYQVSEQDHLGAQCLGFVSFLESAGVMPPAMREIVIDRAMAVPGDPVSLDDLKIIILMVYWSFGTEPDALILDELCDDTEERIAH